MRIRTSLFAVSAAAMLGLAGCGGSAGDTGAPLDRSLRVVEKHHDNGQLAEQGTVLVTLQGEIPHGQWRRWFRDGALQWQGSYDHGALDAARPWREWNDDGSVRNDWRDAADDPSDG